MENHHASSSLTLPSDLIRNDLEIAPITVISMDGFHRYQDDMLAHRTVRDGREISLAEIKGAPETFDLPGLARRIRQVARGEECGWPEYNRLLHNPVENAITVRGKISFWKGIISSWTGMAGVIWPAMLTIRSALPRMSKC